MATKKPAPKKAVKASKPTAKPAKKTTAKPVVKTPVKKVAPAKVIAMTVVKKAVVPVKKTVKPVAKSPIKKAAKKIIPVKVIVKAPAKKMVVVAKKVTPTKPISKATVKKSVVKVVAPIKKVVPVKVMSKPVIKPVVAPIKVDSKPIAVPTKTSAKTKAPIVPTTPAKPVKKALEPIKDVKVGKINTKTSVPYNPVYTPMEKRPTSIKSNNPLVKYSDGDLNEFRDLINKKLDTAKKELAYLQGLITRKDEIGNDEARYMTMEDGSMSMEREQLSQMASRQITYIDHLEKAIMRIENKTYGICRVTGKLIDKARLRAVPHATLSLEAKLGLVKPSNE